MIVFDGWWAARIRCRDKGRGEGPFLAITTIFRDKGRGEGPLLAITTMCLEDTCLFLFPFSMMEVSSKYPFYVLIYTEYTLYHCFISCHFSIF